MRITKCIFYCVLIILAALSTPASAEYNIAGDVNNDGRITAEDSLLALRMATGSVAPDPERADVNADGRVNSLDALVIQTMAEKTQVCVNAPEVVSGAFEVTMDIYNVADLDSGQFDLSFDSSVVNVTAVHDGNIAGTTVLIDSWDFVDADTIRVLSDLPGVAGVSGSGQIATISFEVTGSQGDACVLDISDGELVDTGAEEIPAIWLDDEVTIGEYIPLNRVHNINTGEIFSFIQAAIDDTDTLDGHVLEVGDGVYHENVKVTKSLTIRSLNGSTNCVIQVAMRYDYVVGITVDYVSISGFTVTRTPESAFGGTGIYLNASYCNVSNNNCSNNSIGIYLRRSSNNIISGNNCSNNWWRGICFWRSCNNKLTGNSMSENGIVIWGDSLSDYTHEMDESNTVNGKPVYYWKDTKSGRIPDGAGQVILVNCKDILVEDQELNNANVGVEVAFSSNVAIRNNNCSNNRDGGIRLLYSSNNRISNNDCSKNQYDGIHLDDSSNNSISNNNCSNNNYDGIRLYKSCNNSISSNNCSNSLCGIRLYGSSNNQLTGNIMFEGGISIRGDSLSDYTHEIDESNTVNGKPVYYWKDIESGRIPDGAGQVMLVNCKDILVEDQELNNASIGVEVAFSSNVAVRNNNCSNNFYGIRFYGSCTNAIASNDCSNNNYDGIRLSESCNNLVSSNNCSNNRAGIRFDKTCDNIIYLNNFINNDDNARSEKSTNIWNSTSKINYTYGGETYTNYLGNYRDDYEGSDSDNDGIGDSPCSIDSDRDNCPLVVPFENYSVPTENMIQVSVNAPEVISGAFNATIDVHHVADLDYGQFDLTFDSSVMNVTGVDAGKINNTTVPIACWRFMDANTIRVIFELSGAGGVSGSGYVARIDFETTRAGTNVLDISNGRLVDTGGAEIPAVWIDDEVTIVVPVTVNAPEYVSGAFEATIDIENVTDLDSGQFEFSFDPSVVTVEDVEAGSIDGTEIPVIWSFTDAGTIIATFNLPGLKGVSGSGYVAKIGFEIKGSSGATCVLDISNGWLFDNRAEMIPAIWIDDEVTIGEHIPVNRVHNINTGEDFPFIQAAIDDPDTSDGHIIEVEDGVYHENVKVTKSLTIRSLTGSANCVIQDAGGDHVVEMTADYVSISGFTVKRLPESASGGAGIYIDASYCNVSGNNCSNNRWYGIQLRDSSNTSISNNNCSNNYEAGICIGGSSSNSISSNNCSNNRYGISLSGSSDNRISSNNCSNNYWAGICLGGSRNNVVSGNNCSSNNQDSGIRLGGSSSNIISSNDCSNNRAGIRLYDSSINLIYLNNFRNNAHNINSRSSINIWNSLSKMNYTYEDRNYTNYLGNYWDDYKGSDSDNDGIGDSPYIIDFDRDNCPLIAPFENYSASTENMTWVSVVSVNAPEVVSDAFNATIDVRHVADLNSGQFDLSFDSSIVNVTGVNAGSIDGTTVPIIDWRFIDVDTIRIFFKPDGAGGVNGSGYVARIDFETTMPGTSILDISDGKLVDTRGEEMLTVWVDCEVTVPVPVTVNAPPVVTDTFEVTIDVENVTDLDSGQFELSFDPDVVIVEGVEVGSIGDTEIPVMWIFKNSDTIKALFNIPGTRGVSGSGYVAKISFEIKGSPGATCVLDISNGWLFDNRAEVIPAIWNDCEVTIGEHTPSNRVHNINTGENFSFIQTAIDDPDTSDGDLIEVEDGLYRENVKVTKSLTIRSLNGSANCVIQDAGGNYVVEITADHVSISGFTVAGRRTSGIVCGMAGIHLDASYCDVSDNNCSNNRIGIYLCDSSNNSISNNNCSNNEQAGICLGGSGNNRLSGNAMFENGIVIWGDSPVDYTQEIDETNTVNGKPVYYRKDVESGRIPEGAGQVILANCRDILVENQELNGASIGIEVAFSSNVTVRNNKCSDNRNSGIHLSESHNNLVSSNDCLNNRDGIRLDGSGNNNISSNNCLNNRHDGIRLFESSNNSISKNICSNKEGTGIHLYESCNNVVSSNDCSNNHDDGIRLDGSSNNSISGNDCSSDMWAGIRLYESGNNSISGNNCSNNMRDGIHLYESSDNIIYLNNFINNADNTDSRSSTNIWNSTSEMNYTYTGETFTNYMGNYWDDYEGTDADNDGIGDTPHIVDPEKDDCPLVMPFENYFAPEPAEDMTRVSVDAPEMASGTFDATIEIRNVEDLDSGQFDLSFDSSVVNVTGVNRGEIGGTTVSIVDWRFMDEDTIRVIFELSDGNGVSGSGYVARMDFEVTGSEGDVSVLDISNGVLVDTGGDEMLAIWLDDYVIIAVPVTVNAPEVVSSAFEVTIDIENVTDLDSGQFDLWFDSSVVNVTGVSAGNISGTAVPMDLWVFMDADGIRVLFNLPGLAGVSGSGQIATISFETTGSEGYSVLGISDGLLVNNRADTIPAIWTDDMVISGAYTLVNRVHNLDTGKDFFFIEDAIDDPDTSDGHTIMVGDGVHRENVKVTKSLTILSENGSANCITKAAKGSEHAVEITAEYVNVSGFAVKGAAFLKAGIYLDAGYCNDSINNCSNNCIGIHLDDSSNNIISGNDCSNNEWFGIHLDDSSNNIISGNDCSNNEWFGIHLDGSGNNIISRTNCSNNKRDGIRLSESYNNVIYLNNFINNTDNVDSRSSANIWSSPSTINYTYDGKTFTNYLGNYWDDYSGTDTNNDGIGDSPYRIDHDRDNYPLVVPIENYCVGTEDIREQKEV